MNDLGTKVSRFCEQNFGGLKAACIAADLKYSTLHAQISLEREIPFTTIQRLCDSAGVSLEVFSNTRATIGFTAPQTSDELHRRAASAYSQALRDVQAEMRRHGTDILCDDVLNWLHRNNGRLTDFDALRERVDLFEVPTADSRIMKPTRIGHNSLAAQYFNITETSEYGSRISMLDPGVVEHSLAAHWRVQKTQRYEIEDVSITARIDDRVIDETYRRVMAPVQTLDGKNLTLVFAKVLSSASA